MNKEGYDSAIAIPTKQFFVSMLTRDISLVDAILDLVDNCLDGALRISEDDEVDYSSHKIEITLDESHFSILDNCGGIPRDVARNYAFKMGREPDDERDSDEETIGMYGVGMKRAVFKIGRETTVRTRFDEDAFEVPITAGWLDNKDWDPLPISESRQEHRLTETGTHIHVQDLYPGVARHFANDAFRNDLRTSISEHFSVFLQRGLVISVNEELVTPVLVEVLVSQSPDGPAPYVYQETIEGVSASITVGLNTGRGLVEDDDQAPEFERDRSASTAGWTVFCNDRAVIVGDKSRLTGWGDGIPLYHYQFSIITGIVEFRSKHADRLPITTTKRALDTSSEVWLKTLVKMKQGIRIWINYTNAWKNHPRSDQTPHWEEAKPLSLWGAIDAVTRRPTFRRTAEGPVEFNPQRQRVVPLPPTKTPSSRRVVFSRPVEEIRTVSKAFFDSDGERPGVVGERCFELVLSELLKDEGASGE